MDTVVALFHTGELEQYLTIKQGSENTSVELLLSCFPWVDALAYP